MLLTSIFERDERLEMFMASTGVEAMNLAAEIAPHLVLLDRSLPDREGYAVCRFIKDHPNCGRTKVVFLSVLAYQADWNTWKEVGADGFLRKPFNVDELITEVDRYLGFGAPMALAP